MKKFLGILAIALLAFTSCTTVDSGHKAVKVSWGGQTDMSQVLDEGVDWGIGWLWNETVEYEAREQTITIKAEYNDINDMPTPVEVTLYFKPMAKSLNKLHKEFGEDYKTVKLMPLFKGALKEVVPHYSAQGLNKSDRDKAEKELKDILVKDLATIYVEASRVSITDVDLPKGVSETAVAIATQESRNQLAKKKEAEKTALAQAAIAESKGKYEAALFDAKTKDIMSQPKMLELLKLEIQMQKAKNDEFRAKAGKSEWGENNIFGVESFNWMKSR